jgi:hypothetical protein
MPFHLIQKSGRCGVSPLDGVAKNATAVAVRGIPSPNIILISVTLFKDTNARILKTHDNPNYRHLSLFGRGEASVIDA